MISLKTYLNRATPEADQACRRVVDLFLQGIALHAVEGDKADLERFQADIDKLAKTLSEDTPIPEVYVIVGVALRAMEDYNRRASKVVRRQNIELQHMVSMLTQTVISIGASSEHSVGRLQEIEKSLDRSREVEDIQLLKLRLGECLEAVREESLRQKVDGRAALENLQREVQSAKERIGSGALGNDLDAATGLPGKTEALKALEAAITSPGGKFVVVAVVNRVQAVNARFGYAVGDRVLQAFAEQFGSKLAANDKCFRWQGPCLVAILPRTTRIEQIRAEVRQIADAKLEKTVQVGMRTVLLPISASWTLFALEPPMDVFLKKIEAFTAAQVPRDYA